mmetsp:Transcript_56656/g.151719  ORF Transcript_56656/g.151719 Transcript_56656/m.151719 type:complete len:489 (+) Transcript_56656:1405-2871(+)
MLAAPDLLARVLESGILHVDPGRQLGHSALEFTHAGDLLLQLLDRLVLSVGCVLDEQRNPLLRQPFLVFQLLLQGNKLSVRLRELSSLCLNLPLVICAPLLPVLKQALLLAYGLLLCQQLPLHIIQDSHLPGNFRGLLFGCRGLGQCIRSAVLQAVLELFDIADLPAYLQGLLLQLLGLLGDPLLLLGDPLLLLSDALLVLAGTLLALGEPPLLLGGPPLLLGDLQLLLGDLPLLLGNPPLLLCPLLLLLSDPLPLLCYPLLLLSDLLLLRGDAPLLLGNAPLLLGDALRLVRRPPLLLGHRLLLLGRPPLQLQGRAGPLVQRPDPLPQLGGLLRKLALPLLHQALLVGELLVGGVERGAPPFEFEELLLDPQGLLADLLLGAPEPVADLGKLLVPPPNLHGLAVEEPLGAGKLKSAAPLLILSALASLQLCCERGSKLCALLLQSFGAPCPVLTGRSKLALPHVVLQAKPPRTLALQKLQGCCVCLL